MRLQTAVIVTVRQAPYVAENRAITYDRVDAAEKASSDFLDFTIDLALSSVLIMNLLYW